MSQVTTHVLDTTTGLPAQGVTVVLESDRDEVSSGVTDADGRVSELGPDRLEPGTYRLRFDTATRSPFFPEVTVTFVVQGGRHYHVPLLLNPFGYTTYRGS